MMKPQRMKNYVQNVKTKMHKYTFSPFQFDATYALSQKQIPISGPTVVAFWANTSVL